ncbi:hypothetical protein K523DRAFT_407924 [Schizophyllum commune Tattone D]|nr:hypothetical protein K523DRAFT_407924 [Schizophyllum commune Tattone D]
MTDPVPSKCREDVQLCDRCNYTYSLSFQIPDTASLRIGCLPTTTEARLICDAIAETNGRLKEINHELERLSESRKHMDALRRSLEYSQGVRRALLAPIRRLPTDILSEIFRACCGDAIEIAYERCEPLVLGSVCKSWRDTILGIPTLWAGFTFPWGLDSYYETHTFLVARLRTFLKYSGGVPLRQCIGQRGWSLNAVTGILFKVLLQHSHRWTSLWVCPPPRSPMMTEYSFFSQLEDRSLSRLTSLQGYHRDLCKGNEKNLFHIPSLRSLLIRLEAESDANIVMPNIPWEQLECLHVHGPPLYSLEIFRRCPNVVECCYKHTWHRASSMPIPDIAITLPRLRKLSSEIVEPADAAFLNLLEAPSVESLALDCSTAPQNSQLDKDLGRLIERFSRRLRCLYLNGHELVEELCFSSLRDLHTLELGWDSPWYKQGWMDDLSDVDDTGRPRILPRLLDLQIECPFIAPGALIKVLEARRANGHGFERLMLAAAVVEDDSK